MSRQQPGGGAQIFPGGGGSTPLAPPWLRACMYVCMYVCVYVTSVCLYYSWFSPFLHECLRTTSHRASERLLAVETSETVVKLGHDSRKEAGVFSVFRFPK